MPKLPSLEKLTEVFRTETHGIHGRLLALRTANALLPKRNAASARARLLRLIGFPIGEGTEFQGLPKITGSLGFLAHLVVGKGCMIDINCTFDLEEKITIGDRVALDPEVMLLTSTHELASRVHRAGPLVRNPVVIEAGAWLGARSIILPGVTVGEGAIVNPGAVVNKDVLPHTRVGGIPAVQIEVLSQHETPAS